MKKVVSLPTGSRNVLSRLKKFTSVCLLGGSCLPVSFDSSLPAGNRADCNTCVIVGPEGQAPKELGIGLKFPTWLMPLCAARRVQMQDVRNIPSASQRTKPASQRLIYCAL